MSSGHSSPRPPAGERGLMISPRVALAQSRELLSVPKKDISFPSPPSHKLDSHNHTRARKASRDRGEQQALGASAAAPDRSRRRSSLKLAPLKLTPAPPSAALGDPIPLTSTDVKKPRRSSYVPPLDDPGRLQQAQLRADRLPDELAILEVNPTASVGHLATVPADEVFPFGLTCELGEVDLAEGEERLSLQGIFEAARMIRGQAILNDKDRKRLGHLAKLYRAMLKGLPLWLAQPKMQAWFIPGEAVDEIAVARVGHEMQRQHVRTTTARSERFQKDNRDLEAGLDVTAVAKRALTDHTPIARDSAGAFFTEVDVVEEHSVHHEVEAYRHRVRSRGRGDALVVGQDMLQVLETPTHEALVELAKAMHGTPPAKFSAEAVQSAGGADAEAGDDALVATTSEASSQFMVAVGTPTLGQASESEGDTPVAGAGEGQVGASEASTSQATSLLNQASSTSITSPAAGSVAVESDAVKLIQPALVPSTASAASQEAGQQAYDLIFHLKRRVEYQNRNRRGSTGGIGTEVTLRPHAEDAGEDEDDDPLAKTFNPADLRRLTPISGGDSAAGGSEAMEKVVPRKLKLRREPLLAISDAAQTPTSCRSMDLAASGASSPADVRFRISLVRHGFSNGNAGRLCQGHTHGELVPTGVAQALGLGRALAQDSPPFSKGFTQVHTSDLLRVRQTAAVAYHAAGWSVGKVPPHLVPRVDPLLREKHGGPFEGGPRAKILAARSASKLGRAYRPEGGETWDDVQVRAKHWMRKTIAQLRGEAEAQHVLVFTHGGWIKEFINAYLRTNNDCPNASYNTSVYQFDVLASVNGHVKQVTPLVNNEHTHALPATRRAAGPQPKLNMNELLAKTGLAMEGVTKDTVAPLIAHDRKPSDDVPDHAAKAAQEPAAGAGGGGVGAGTGEAEASQAAEVAQVPQRPAAPRHRHKRPASSKQSAVKLHFLRVLGRGATGKVYLAELHRGYGVEQVAVKQLIPRHNNGNGVARMLKVEASMLSKLSHPNVIRYRGLHFSKTKRQYSLLMEFAPHGTLAQLLKNHPEGMPEHELAHLLAQLLQGVAYLHSQRIIHRDIKPGNLLLTKPNHLAIADFDVATQVVRLQTQLRSCVGTPWYTAPEVIMVEPYSSAADIWSIGCCVLHMATGKRPFGGCNHIQAAYKMVNEPTPQLPEGHTLSEEVLDFMNLCWKRDPRQRPAAATLLHHVLLRKYLLTPSKTPSTAARAPKPPVQGLASAPPTIANAEQS